ncbi:MAG: hypothetical protein A2137_04375 [Chloroflexi bacterium RBG_16_58_8]|nr:MAG: hypothetical protein A2137_04375 [Chloroflexi bacterium RBG_16_58_8]
MTAGTIVRRLGAVLLTLVVLMTVVYTPVFAGGETEVKGTIDAKVPLADLPAHAIEHGVIKMLEVGGVHVLVTGDTVIEGMLKLGAEVEAEGAVHAIFADEIEVVDDAEADLDAKGLDVSLEGTMSELITEIDPHMAEHGVIKVLEVGGIHVLVTKDTVLDGMLAVGAGVKIDGTLHALFATEIEVED